MIAIPTNPDLHIVFDAAAWGAGLALGLLIAWLRPATGATLFGRNPAYLVALGVGVVAGAYLAGAFPGLAVGRWTLGHSIAGALAGGILAVELYKLAAGVRGSTGGAFVAPLAIGIAIGRWGCLYAGLPDRTYGTPTALPWGVDLGDGIARHPVQIYESAAMSAFLAVYLVALAQNRSWAARHAFHIFAIYYGAQRFFWEFLKPYPAVLGPLNLFHFLCIGLIIYGVVWIYRDRRAPGPA